MNRSELRALAEGSASWNVPRTPKADLLALLDRLEAAEALLGECADEAVWVENAPLANRVVAFLTEDAL